MPEPLSLITCLQIAQAIEMAAPFDAASAFLLASELEGVIDLRLPVFLDSALQEELDGVDDAELYRSAVARAMLRHLIIVLQQGLESVRAEETVAAR